MYFADVMQIKKL